MKKNKLGLPLEYQLLPEYFDVLSHDNNSDKKNAVIEAILRKYKVKTVLDLTCGTGCQVFWLAKLGYEVTGSDFSLPLVKIARNKAKQQKIKVDFIEGDMREIRVGNFDAVITIFNAIGHLTKAGFSKAIRNIRANLKDDGIYVFDIFNLNAMNKKTVSNLAMDFTKNVDDTKLHAIQHSKINKKTGLLTSFDVLTIKQGLNKPKIFKSKFSLQIYTAKQIRKILADNGFEVLDQCETDGSKFLEYKSLNILTVARKKLAI